MGQDDSLGVPGGHQNVHDYHGIRGGWGQSPHILVVPAVSTTCRKATSIPSLKSLNQLSSLESNLKIGHFVSYLLVTKNQI